MVSITSPQSTFTESDITITWSLSDAASTQNAYEFVYKLKTDSAWTSMGKITSTDTSASIAISTFNTMVEYYYRIILYLGNGDIEYSQAYSILIHPKKLGSVKIQVTSNSIQEIPFYETKCTTPSVAIQTSSGAGHLPLVASDDAAIPVAHSSVKIQTSNGKKTFLQGYSNFINTGIDAGGDFYRSYIYNSGSYNVYRSEGYTYQYVSGTYLSNTVYKMGGYADKYGYKGYCYSYRRYSKLYKHTYSAKMYESKYTYVTEYKYMYIYASYLSPTAIYAERVGIYSYISYRTYKNLYANGTAYNNVYDHTVNYHSTANYQTLYGNTTPSRR